jgi:hypothetical protein
MDYREMTALGREPHRVRAIASTVLDLLAGDLSERSSDLLTKLTKYDGKQPLSTRQLEALYALRERSTRRSIAGGYRASVLVQEAYEARLDLVEYDDEEWITEMHARGSQLVLSTNQWRRLIYICKDLQILEQDTWIEL